MLGFLAPWMKEPGVLLVVPAVLRALAEHAASRAHLATGAAAGSPAPADWLVLRHLVRALRRADVAHQALFTAAARTSAWSRGTLFVTVFCGINCVLMLSIVSMASARTSAARATAGGRYPAHESTVASNASQTA